MAFLFKSTKTIFESFSSHKKNEISDATIVCHILSYQFDTKRSFVSFLKVHYVPKFR